MNTSAMVLAFILVVVLGSIAASGHPGSAIAAALGAICGYFIGQANWQGRTTPPAVYRGEHGTEL